MIRLWGCFRVCRIAPPGKSRRKLEDMNWFKPPDFLNQVLIRPFREEDQAPAKKLILNGLSERWGWLDPRKNPDLEDIRSYFAEGVFLLAEHRGEIVGTGGLLQGGEGRAQIVRVHVAEHVQRQGLGSLILSKLCEKAMELGCQRVFLETTESWEDVIRFYESNGFHITHYTDDKVYLAKQLDVQTQGA